MLSKTQPSRTNRIMALLAVACLVGLAGWAHLCARVPLPRPAADARSAPRGPTHEPGALRIISGPEIAQGNGRAVLRWETSAPADSLLSYGRHDALEHILVKDAQRTTLHEFALPDLRAIEFCRFYAMSVDAEGNRAIAGLEPGEGPGGAMLAPAAPGILPAAPAGLSPSAAAPADWNLDGSIDLLVLARLAGGARPLLLWQGGGQFLDATPRALAARPRAASAAWGDCNGDGYPDLLTCGSSMALWVNSGPPRWTLEPVEDALPGATGQSWRWVAFAQLDGDGMPDVVAGDEAGGVWLFANAGGPGLKFREPVHVSPPAPAGAALQSVLCADLTDDGLTDLVLVYGSPAAWILMRNTGAGFEPLPLPVPGAGSPDADHAGASLLPSRPTGGPVAADCDADGDLDLYVPLPAALRAAGGAASGVLLINEGGGRFSVAQETGELAEVRGVVTCAAWQDLTGNGRPDLVLGMADGVRVLFNTREGGFVDGTDLCDWPQQAAQGVESVTVADLTGDGAPDVLLFTSGGGCHLLENRCTAAAREQFLTVRPTGRAGVAGAVALLKDAAGSRVLASGRVPPGGPMECWLGAQYLEEGVVEVRYSDGVQRAIRWSGGSSSRVLQVSRPD